MTLDYRFLLKKYIAHVAEAEGPEFATRMRLMAPCDVGDFEYTTEEETALRELFAELK